MTGKRISGITCIIKSAMDSASWCVLHRIAGRKKLPANSSNCRKSWQPREARQARMFISYSEVSIKNPDNSGQTLPLTYVCCREQAEDGACWHLLTSEKVASAADARRIVSHYERRRLIEEYHKAWKSDGTCVESLRMQTRDNLERMVVIKAFIAVRVLGLSETGETGAMA
ncbi:hypothetical protein JNE17039_45850 (plasmid) [Escherichia coli]